VPVSVNAVRRAMLSFKLCTGGVSGPVLGTSETFPIRQSNHWQNELNRLTATVSNRPRAAVHGWSRYEFRSGCNQPLSGPSTTASDSPV